MRLGRLRNPRCDCAAISGRQCGECPTGRSKWNLLRCHEALDVRGAPRRAGSHLEIDVDAAERTSPLRRCQYSVDAGSWTPIEAEDGVTDSPNERFLLRLDDLHPGEHVVVFRVYDAANNAGLAKVVVR